MELAPDHYEADRRRVEAGENGGAGLWVTNHGGSVLLVRDEGDEGWVDPGGKRETGESFEAAAHRETREEAGIECEIRGLLSAHVTELVDATDPERSTLYSLIAIFTGEAVAEDYSPANRSPRIRHRARARERSRPSTGSTPRPRGWAILRSPNDRSRPGSDPTAGRSRCESVPA